MIIWLKEFKSCMKLLQGFFLIVVIALNSGYLKANELSVEDIVSKTEQGQRLLPVMIRFEDQKPDIQSQSLLNLNRTKSLVGKGKVTLQTKQMTFDKLMKTDQRFDSLVRKIEARNRNLRNTRRFNGQAIAGVSERKVTVSAFDDDLLALSMTQEELLALQSDTSVSIYENKFYFASLSNSVPVVFPGQATSNFDGSGRTVALLDFGVNPNHNFLIGRLKTNVSACFSNSGVVSNGQANPVTESLCINEQASSIGTTSGDNCASSIFGCEHGTQMAGIIAGSNASSSGVATGTQLVSIQVGTRANDEAICGDASITPCVGAFSFDIQQALTYVSGIVASENIAAVNISLSTEAAQQGQCDNDPLKPAIDTLVSQRVAVIASSGNRSSGNSMSSPACISSAIAVAATDNSDSPLALNNRSSELDFFAPGENILTSSLDNNNAFSTTTGTSASAAHVSGAWAVLKERVPNASVAAVEDAFVTTGESVTQGLFARPRIRIDLALNALQIPEITDDFCFPIIARNGNVATICL